MHTVCKPKTAALDGAVHFCAGIFRVCITRGHVDGIFVSALGCWCYAHCFLENTINERLENMHKMHWLQIRANMPQVEVRPSKIQHPTAGRGLFNASGAAIMAGTIIAVLSSGKRYPCMGSHGVVVAGNCHQKYKITPDGDQWAADSYKGLLGGAANEGDAVHANNCVIVEMPIGVNHSVAYGATFIVAVSEVPAGAEYFVYYGDDTKWAFRIDANAESAPQAQHGENPCEDSGPH